MYDLFFQKFREKVPLTHQEEEHIKSYLTPKGNYRLLLCANDKEKLEALTADIKKTAIS